jgi:arginine repressor
MLRTLQLLYYQMAAVGDQVALRAEVHRLKELMASKDEVIASKNEVIASKNAQLSSRDEIITLKDEVIACKEAVLSRTIEELQQLKSVSSSKPAAAADNEHDTQQPNSKRQRMCDFSSGSSSSSSSFEVASPLDKDEILDHVIGYVGGGDHLYIGGVNRKWRGRYMQYCAQNSSSKYDKKFVTRQLSMTMLASRLQLAVSSGCKVSRWTFEKWSHAELVRKYSIEPQQVLTVLRLHGVPWSTTLCEVAAFNCKLSLLQWLHASSCSWKEPAVFAQASRGGSVAMLEWLLTVTAPRSGDLKNMMLTRAGWSNNLEAAKWLLAQGAEWPEAFTGDYISSGATVQQCWSLSAVR